GDPIRKVVDARAAAEDRLAHQARCPGEAEARREIRLGCGIDAGVSRRCKDRAAVYLELRGRNLRNGVAGVSRDRLCGNRARCGAVKSDDGTIVTLCRRSFAFQPQSQVQSETRTNAEVVLQEGRI